jgi:hypothetical protein
MLTAALRWFVGAAQAGKPVTARTSPPGHFTGRPNEQAKTASVKERRHRPQRDLLSGGTVRTYHDDVR